MGWFADIALPLVVNVGGPLLAEYLSRKETDKARQSIDESTERAAGESERQYQDRRADIERRYQDTERRYQDTRADTQLLLDSQKSALGRLEEMSTAGFDPSNIPGYEFAKAEGEKSIAWGGAARGMFNSGRTGKELIRYGTDYASNVFNQEWARQMQLAQLGTSGVNARVGAGGVFSPIAPSSNVSSLFQNRGVNQASITAQQSAGTSSTIQNIMDTFNRSRELLAQLKVA